MTQPGAKRYRIPIATRSEESRNLGLGRHVNHDPRSRAYAYRSRQLAALGPVLHERHVPIFDQGQLGSCTGNAGLGILATGPYWDDLTPEQQENGLTELGNGPRYTWDEAGAKQLYSDVTADDDFAGQWPPTDTGSDGLSVGKELVKRGVIPGYQHTFDINSALAALQQFPLLVGTEWLDQMFYPDAYGRITVKGPVDGGHEWIVDEYVPAGSQAFAGDVLSKTDPYIGGTTSWGTSFGVRGRFYIPVKSFTTLLAADGDVMVLTPPTAPPPVPDPPSSGTTDQNLAAAMRAWLAEHPDL